MKTTTVPLEPAVEFAENHEPRCPCVLVPDTSGWKPAGEGPAGVKDLTVCPSRRTRRRAGGLAWVASLVLAMAGGGRLLAAGVGAAPAELKPGARWTNSLGMVFVGVPGAPAFCIWETRVQDFAVFARDTEGNGGWDYKEGNPPVGLKGGKVEQSWDYGWDKPGFAQTGEHPVTCVSWQDARAFCRWLTARERARGLLTANQQYRLPTDAEWSVAVGLPAEEGRTPEDKDEKIKEVYPWGKEWPPPKGAGNYADATAKRAFSGWSVIGDYDDGYATTAPVGSFSPNRYGLYDLGGNVLEWCEDWYDTEQRFRVLRGASWYNDGPRSLWSSNRYGSTPDFRNYFIGFRCVLVVGSAAR